ncbi:hypothetical protein KBC75_00895 [Candidatus Shapirobacteria bacterium]|nr:hypothetical protein [Candidatus Shapirobacteria bacterium]
MKKIFFSILIIVSLFVVSLAYTFGYSLKQNNPNPDKGCFVGGCNGGDICSNTKDIWGNCVSRNDFCYKVDKCAMVSQNNCQFRPTFNSSICWVAQAPVLLVQKVIEFINNI